MNQSKFQSYFISYKKQSEFIQGLNQEKISPSLLAVLIDALFNSFYQTNFNDKQKYKTIFNDLHERITSNMNRSFDTSLEVLHAIRTFGNFFRIVANEEGNEEIKYLIRQFEFGYHAQALNIDQSGESEVLTSALSFLGEKNNPLIVFDVGANKGEFIKAVLKLNHAIKIHSFEPQSSLVNDLNATIQAIFTANNLHEVFIRSFGLSNKNGDFDLFKSSKDDVLASTVLKVGDSFSDKIKRPEKIQLMRGDDYCISHNVEIIDYLKVDTEGSELEVLKGFTSLIKNKSIRMIQFEYGVNTALASNTLHDFYALFAGEYLFARIMPEGLEIRPEYEITFEDFYWSNYLAIDKSIANQFISYLKN